MKSHLKRLTAPKTWPLKRKGITFITRPAPSGAPMDLSLPLVIAMKELLNLAGTTKEIKQIIHNQDVLINGAKVKKHDQAAGLMSILAFPALKAAYRVTITKKNTLALVAVTGEDAKRHAVKVTRKTILGKDRVQINCLDGTNFLLSEKEARGYKRGDTLLLGTEGTKGAKAKVAGHLSFEKGALVLLTRGRHVGMLATVKGFDAKTVTIADANGNEFETRRAYCFVVGKGKPAFVVQEK